MADTTAEAPASLADHLNAIGDHAQGMADHAHGAGAILDGDQEQDAPDSSDDARDSDSDAPDGGPGRSMPVSAQARAYQFGGMAARTLSAATRGRR